MKEQIKELLELFQKVYDEKDVNKVEDFMSTLFINDNDISILGTSDGEVCLNYEACRELFTSDWEYWGFEKLHLEQAVELDLDKIVVVYVPSSFTFTFEGNEEKRKSHFDYLLDLLKDDSEDKRDLKVKFSDMNHVLAHIYHNREGNRRKYRYELKVTFILIKTEAGYKVKQINFSVPDNIKRPDLRLYTNSPFNQEFENKIASTSNNQELRVQLNQIFNNYFNVNLMDNYYSNNNLIFANVDNKVAYSMNEAKEIVKFQNKYWDSVSIRTEDALIYEVDNQAIVLAKGLATTLIKENEYLEQTRNEILALKDNDKLTYLDKMFEVRKLISVAFKETMIGEEHKHPIRVNLVLTKSDDKWVINYLQLSYSFYYLLEDRNEHMSRIEM